MRFDTASYDLPREDYINLRDSQPASPEEALLPRALFRARLRAVGVGYGRYTNGLGSCLGALDALRAMRAERMSKAPKARQDAAQSPTGGVVGRGTKEAAQGPTQGGTIQRGGDSGGAVAPGSTPRTGVGVGGELGRLLRENLPTEPLFGGTLAVDELGCVVLPDFLVVRRRDGRVNGKASVRRAIEHLFGSDADETGVGKLAREMAAGYVEGLQEVMEGVRNRDEEQIKRGTMAVEVLTKSLNEIEPAVKKVEQKVVSQRVVIKLPELEEGQEPVEAEWSHSNPFAPMVGVKGVYDPMVQGGSAQLPQGPQVPVEREVVEIQTQETLGEGLTGAEGGADSGGPTGGLSPV